MKKRIAVVSMLALVILGSGVGVLPSQAASAGVGDTVVYQGYIVTWSSADPADVTIDRTSARADRFPRVASPSGVHSAGSRVSALSVTSAAQRDSCTAVPDNFGSANFTPACDIHDLCYSRKSSTDRLQCDRQLLTNLRLACYQAYSTDYALLLSCYTVAAVYYVGVRLFGGSFYAGKGNPA